MKLSIGHQTDVGRKRNANQDSYAVYPGEKLANRLDALLVVADGMGGAKGGEVASDIVAKSVPQAVQSGLVMRRSGANGAGVDVRALLHDAIMQANGDVYRQKVESPDLKNMGTTCVAAVVQDNRLTVGNVGDSRAYLLRAGRLSQISEDHSLVWQQYRAGNLTREQLRTSQFRNQITRGIGLTPNVEPEMHSLTLEDGDTLLLCSDGLTTEVTDEEIARILATTADPQETCDQLVQTANRNGGSDNITVTVLRYGAFTPLALADTRFDPNALLEDSGDDTDEDDITDEQQNWRRQPAPLANVYPPASRPVLSDEDDEDDEERYAPRPLPRNAAAPSGKRSNPPFSPVSLSVAAVLLVVVAVLGWLFYRATGERDLAVKKYQELANDAKKQVAAGHAAPRNLVYAAPVAVLGPTQWVQNAPLSVFTNDDLLVISTKNKIWRVTPATKGLKTVGTAPLPPVPAASSSDADTPAAPPAPTTARYAAAVDNEGNYYQIIPAQKAIEKYSFDGAKLATIGAGTLTAPTAIAVDAHGNLYVIDNHVLKRLAASEAPANAPAATNTTPE